MTTSIAELTTFQIWLPVLVPIALGLLLVGLATQFRDGIQHTLLRRALRMAGVLLITYGLVLTVTRLVALDLVTLSRTVGQLFIIALGAYILWEGLELLLTVVGSELRERTDDAEAQSRVETLVTLTRWVGGVLVTIVAVAMALSVLNVDVTPLIAGAGIAGLAISLGAQTLVQDLIAGVLIVVEDQYHVGDVVDIGGKVGTVEHISLRATHLRDLNGTLHIVPHSTVTTVSNLTSSWARAVVDVGVSYESDLAQVVDVLERVGKTLFEGDAGNDFFIEAPVVTGPESFGDSAIVVRLMGRVYPGTQWDAQRLMRRRIKAAFDAEGIEIPYPQRGLHVRSVTSEEADDGTGATQTGTDSGDIEHIHGNVDETVEADSY